MSCNTYTAWAWVLASVLLIEGISQFFVKPDTLKDPGYLFSRFVVILFLFFIFVFTVVKTPEAEKNKTKKA
jgi:L-asparagine transporter-like permease